MSPIHPRSPTRLAAITAALLMTPAVGGADHDDRCVAADTGQGLGSTWVASAPPIATPSLLTVARHSAAALAMDLTDHLSDMPEAPAESTRAAVDGPSVTDDGSQLSATELYQRVLKYQQGPAAAEPAPALAGRPMVDPDCLSSTHAAAG